MSIFGLHQKKAASAIDILYHELGRKILNVLLKRNGGDLQAAEQVLQDTFLADYYRHQVHYKSKVFVPSIEQFNLLVDPGISPEEMLTLEELKFQVNKCLNLLPGEYRRLLHFKYYQELSTREICFKLNLTPRSLEGKLYRAKKALSKIYAQSEAGPKSPSGK